MRSAPWPPRSKSSSLPPRSVSSPLPPYRSIVARTPLQQVVTLQTPEIVAAGPASERVVLLGAPVLVVIRHSELSMQWPSALTRGAYAATRHGSTL